MYDLVKDEYSVLGEYVNNKEKILMRHNTCGHEYMVQPNKFLTGRRCPKCSHGSTLKGLDQFKSEVYDLVGDEYTVLGNYEGNNTKILMRHNTCGHEYMVTPVKFSSGNRCPKCSHGSTRKTIEDIKKEIEEVDPNYELVSEYKGRKTKVKLRHSCGCEFETYIWNFLKNGVRCPNCKDYSSSSSEKELLNYIKEIYKGDIKNNYKLSSKKSEKEIDIYLPDLKMGFEFDGLYWHSVEKSDDKFNLLHKTEYFNEKGIRIIHIFEDEWENKKDIVKDKIRSIIGLNNENRIYARKCDVVELDQKEANDFMNKHHIQGCGSSSYKVGLKYKGELVAVMTFCKARSQVVNQREEGLIELFRFSTTGSVVGGFSKLLKFSINKYKFKKIITFADRRWSSDENVYIKNGFKFLHYSEPSYWYFINKTRYHRSTFMKHKLKDKFKDIYDDSLTEKEIMAKAGYKRIYDCGTAVYLYNTDSQPDGGSL